jgi:multicomponent Na+:H+ antiporter subunit E
MKHTGPDKNSFATTTQALLTRIPLFALLWVVLTGGRAESWLLGLPAVLIAAWVSVKARRFPTLRLSLWGSVRFMGFFLRASLISGLDVVRRAFHPKLRLHPDLIDYRLSLSTEAARIFMADAISLLPGTLSVEMAGVHLTVHVLDRSMPIQAELKALEERVAAMLEAQTSRGTALEGGGP